MITTLRDVRVLVTGVAGFIGSHLARRLLEEGAMVHGMVKEDSDLWRIQDIKEQVQLHYADLRDYASVKKVVQRARPQKIFHLAACVNVSRSFEVLDRMIEVNLNGTLRLLQALDGTDYDCLLNTGTCEEYGDNPVPFREDQTPNPVSPYSATKTSATMFCQMLHKTMGLPILTLRPFLTYGPMQDNVMLIPSLIKKALRREDFKMTAGEQTREFNYIDDIIDGYIRASQTGQAIGQIINIGNGTEYRIKDVVLKTLDLMGNPIQPLLGALPYREGEAMHFYCDNSKAKELLNWRSKTSLEEGLKKTIDWYSANQRT